MEVTRQQPMRRKVLAQHVEELHQPRRDILGLAHCAAQRPDGRNPFAQLRGRVRHLIPPASGRIPHPEVTRGHRIQHGAVELKEVVGFADQHDGLHGRLSRQVVADGVVGKVVEDLERQEEAWGRDRLRPVEDGLVDDFHLVEVAAAGGRPHQRRVLDFGQRVADLDDLVLRARVHVRVHVADVVEDVEHERAAAGAHFVDDQVVVRVRRQFVVGHKVAGNGLAVVRAEELRRRVPELSRVRGSDLVELVLEIDIPLGKDVLELGLVAKVRKVEGLAGCEDGDLLGEVAVVGIVEAVCSIVRKENRMSMSRASLFSFLSSLFFFILGLCAVAAR